MTEKQMKRQIETRLSLLEKAITKVQKRLSHAPEGYLKIASRPSRPFSYYRFLKGQRSKGTYLRKSEEPLIRSLAQKSYDQKILPALKRERALLKKLKETYEAFSPEEFFSALPQSRQALISQHLFTDADAAEAFLSAPYVPLEYKDSSPSIAVTDNLKVRSKSESLVALFLLEHKIPFRYEAPLFLRKGGTVYPDFTLLHPLSGDIIYWEHFGYLDEPGYLEKAIKKLRMYAENGIFPGINLIITYETKNSPLDYKQVDLIGKQYLLL